MKKLIFGLGMLLATNNMLALSPCENLNSLYCSATLAPIRNQETPAYNCGPVQDGQTPNKICVNMGECLFNGESAIQCLDYTPTAPSACLPIGEFCKENSQCCNNQCFGASVGKGGYCYPNKNDACLFNADCGDGGTCNKLTGTCNPKVCQTDNNCDSSNGMYCVPYYTNNNGTQYTLQQSFCTYWGGWQLMS
jgi:hypothetical protein